MEDIHLLLGVAGIPVVAPVDLVEEAPENLVVEVPNIQGIDYVDNLDTEDILDLAEDKDLPGYNREPLHEEAGDDEGEGVEHHLEVVPPEVH